jgi:hypothetical protein
MADLLRQVTWGVMGGAATRAARSAASRRLHGPEGEPLLLLRPAPERSGLGTVLILAAITGVVLAIADALKEQRKLSSKRSIPPDIYVRNH